MEINLTDLECQRTAVDTFLCVAEQPAAPVWFYPVVLACFAMAVVILVLVLRLFFGRPKGKQDRRETFVNPSTLPHKDRRKGFGT